LLNNTGVGVVGEGVNGNLYLLTDDDAGNIALFDIDS